MKQQWNFFFFYSLNLPPIPTKHSSVHSAINNVPFIFHMYRTNYHLIMLPKCMSPGVSILAWPVVLPNSQTTPDAKQRTQLKSFSELILICCCENIRVLFLSCCSQLHNTFVLIAQIILIIFCIFLGYLQIFKNQLLLLYPKEMQIWRSNITKVENNNNQSICSWLQSAVDVEKMALCVIWRLWFVFVFFSFCRFIFSGVTLKMSSSVTKRLRGKRVCTLVFSQYNWCNSCYIFKYIYEYNPQYCQATTVGSCWDS